MVTRFPSITALIVSCGLVRGLCAITGKAVATMAAMASVDLMWFVICVVFIR